MVGPISTNLPWDDPNHDILGDILRTKSKYYLESYRNFKRLYENQVTPIKCFRVKGLQIFTEDWAGLRELVCICPSEQMRDWLISCMVSFHERKVLDWNEEYNG